MLLACGDSVLRAAIAINEECAAQAGAVRRLVLHSQLTQLEEKREPIQNRSFYGTGTSPEGGSASVGGRASEAFLYCIQHAGD